MVKLSSSFVIYVSDLLLRCFNNSNEHIFFNRLSRVFVEAVLRSHGNCLSLFTNFDLGNGDYILELIIVDFLSKFLLALKTLYNNLNYQIIDTYFVFHMPKNVYIHIHIYTYMYIHTYIFVYIIYYMLYIYLYIYICIHIYTFSKYSQEKTTTCDN